MSSPVIWNGKRGKLLTQNGFLLSAGNTIDYDGAINYILNPGFEINANGYNAYANTAQATPVNGTGGSPTVTITQSTTNPLFQSASGLFTHAASNQQGQGFSYDFTIDAGIETAATPCTISGYYNVASGTYDSGIIVWIYDKTNSVLIPVSAATINNNIGASPFQCEFQPNTNSTSYRLIFHCSTTTATAYTLQFDNIAVRPNTYNPGAAVTAWAAYTPVFSAGFGTTTITNFIYRRAGSCLEVTGTFASGTVAASIATMTLPSGLSIDSTVLTQGNTSSGAGPQVGYWIGNSNGNEGAVLAATGTNAALFYFSAIGSSNQLIPQNGTGTFSSGQTIAFYASVPIAGWGVTQNLSSDTDTRVCAANYYASANNASSTTQTANFDTKVLDTHGAVTASAAGTGAWKFTAPIPGDYVVCVTTILGSATNTGATGSIYKNGTILQNTNTTSNQFFSVGSIVIPLIAGDFIDYRASAAVTIAGSSAGGYDQSSISIYRLSGPAQIAASESINMRYTGASATLTGSDSLVTYTTKDYDSHNAYSSGVYTCPAPGKYLVISRLISTDVSGVFTPTQSIYHNNVQVTQSSVGINNTAASNAYTSVSDQLNCLAGDTIKIEANSNGTTPSVVSSTIANVISIARVGN